MKYLSATLSCQMPPNLTTQGVRELWRMRLRQKFQNNRKRKDSSLPIVQERKKKTKTATDETPSQNRAYKD
ncbi:uncharacterized protein LOC143253944 isoform X2 [Tachypleus tridentatus]|uniref:uncharacterized protein LOC143253944 isoform X2 n=1 Tax=Tachypleus tridentatus TaxID=6853 RepID=UPI003FD331D9